MWFYQTNPVARRLIAFLEAKRKKAEEEGIETTPEERLELETLKMESEMLNDEPELGNSVETPSSLVSIFYPTTNSRVIFQCQSESSSSNKLSTVVESALEEAPKRDTPMSVVPPPPLSVSDPAGLAEPNQPEA